MVETKHQPQELLDEVERGVNLHNIKEENVKKSFVGAFSISEKSYHTINDLLEKNTSRFHIQMNDLFANHLSHGLVALFKLGASSDRLNQYYKNYTSATSSKPLEPARPVDPSVDINESNWEQFIGKQQYFPNLKQFFKQQLEMIEDEEEDRGHRTRILVKKYFPKLAKGLIGDAFHGMIQLGYGLEIMNETTVIEGLAFLAYVNLPLGEISTNPHHSITESIIDITGAVRSDPNTQKLLKTMQERDMNFTDRVELVAKNQELLREFDIKIMADRDPIEVLDRIWKGCIQAYLSSDNDFFVLHCVTGCRCMQTIVPLLAPDDRVRAVQYFWKAVVAAYICRNAPELDQSKWVIHKASSLPTWDKIIAKALKPPQDTSKENTHSIKLVFCCLENDRDLGYDPLHRLAAARRVELVPWPPL